MMKKTQAVALFGGATTLAFGCLLATGGCSSPNSSSPGQDAATDSSSQKDGSKQMDAASKDTSAQDTSTGDTSTDTSMSDVTGDAISDSPTDTKSEGACDKIELTIINYKKWCSVSVNGDKASDDETQTVCVASGTKVDLKAGPESKKFELGKDPWHDTTTEDGGDATIKVTAKDDCVWVCCPFADGGTGCPTKSQCP
jgi:hypothetical protein